MCEMHNLSMCVSMIHSFKVNMFIFLLDRSKCRMSILIKRKRNILNTYNTQKHIIHYFTLLSIYKIPNLNAQIIL